MFTKIYYILFIEELIIIEEFDMKEEHREHLRELWKDPKRREYIGNIVRKSWEDNHDEITRSRRDSDNRKYIDLKEYKQTDFGTGVRNPDGYREYQREVQRIYRENNPEIMEYYKRYNKEKKAREKAAKAKKIQDSLMTPSQVVGRYVVTIDGRFFNISNGKEYVPDRYIIFEGKRYRKDRFVQDLFFPKEEVVDIDISEEPEINYYDLTDEQIKILEQVDKMGLDYEIWD